MRHVALFCHRHAWWVLASWLVVLAAVTSAGQLVGNDYRDSMNLPASDSTRAQELLKQTKGSGQGEDQESIVFSTDRGRVTASAVRSRIEPMLRKVVKQPHVSQVVSPYVKQGRAQVSQDGTVAFASVAYGSAANDVSVHQAEELVRTAQDAGDDHLRVEVSGAIAERAAPPTLGNASIGLLAAAVVLLFTFGSLFSMLLPVLTAAVSVTTGIGVLGLLTHSVEMPQVSPEIAALMGLGVGVDYALFIVTRYRQALMAGREQRGALGEAAVTSGRSVLFAGVTVCVALLGMFTVQLDFLNGLAIGSAVAVLLTMAAALTLLPALLRLFGNRVLSRRERRRLAAGKLCGEHEGRLWLRWARGMTRHPVLPGIAALLVVVVLAVPFLSLRMGIADSELDKKGSTTREAYDMLAEGFGPGFNGPLMVTTKVPDTDSRHAVYRAAKRIARESGVATVSSPRILPASGGGRIGTVTVYPEGAPQDASTDTLVHTLRDDVLPKAARDSRARFHVGGATATYTDFSSAITDRLPLFVATVVGISFVLLTLVFRSLLIPLTAAVLNVLAAATAFGVITAVFQWGWLGALVGMSATGPVEPYVPVLLFAGLFGLSMDYEVFLVTRVQEEWHGRLDNRQAVVHGLAATGRTITAAALIMVLVFGSFMLGGDRVVKMAGLGLAVAVLLDAVVVRSVLVPAVMVLCGRGNWWLPGWLERLLPRISVEGPEDPDVAADYGGDAAKAGRTDGDTTA